MPATTDTHGLRAIGQIMPGVVQTVARRMEARPEDKARRIIWGGALCEEGRPYRFKGGDTNGWDGWGLVRYLSALSQGLRADDLPDVPRLSPDPAEAVSMNTARRHLLAWGFREIAPSKAEPGDVLVIGAGGGVYPAVLVESVPGAERVMVHVPWGRAATQAFMGNIEDRVIAAFTMPSPPPPPEAGAVAVPERAAA